MKFLITGDCHLTSKRPGNRCDDYWETIKRKFQFVLSTASDKGVDYVLCPGDLTDSPFISWSDFSEIVHIINYNEVNILVPWGQHDLRYRTRGNTALDALSASCKSLFVMDGRDLPEEKICIYSAPYGSDIPEIKDKDDFNVLLVHRMIIKDNPLWEGQTDYVSAKNFLRKYPFNLVVSGDNHQSFVEHNERRNSYLFNCGSLTRSRIDQIDHEPVIYICDTETKKFEKIFIPIEPAGKVFLLDKIEREKERNADLDSFVSGLLEYEDMGLDFGNNLSVYCKENTVDKEIVSIIDEAKEEI